MNRGPLLDTLLVAGFLAGIGAPIVDQSIGEDTSVEVEFREETPRPSFEWTVAAIEAYPAEFDAWYSDTFGLRDVLIRWHNILKWKGLGASPTPLIVQGKGEWTFASWGNATETFCGIDPLPQYQLAAWGRMLELRRDWLETQGCRYLFTLVPNKNTLYPELMPARFRRQGPSRREQFFAYMDQHSDVDVLDLTPALLLEKRNDAPEFYVYFRLGDHWNDRGAFTGAAAIIERLAEREGFTSLRPESRDRYDLLPAGGPGDSWAGRLYMEDVLTQSFHFMMPKLGRTAVRLPEPTRRLLRFRKQESSEPSAVVFHDSFGDSILPFLAEYFSELTAWRGEFDEALVLAEEPDVVLELFTERVLATQTPAVSGEAAREWLKELFDRSTTVALSVDVESDENGLEAVGGTRIAPLRMRAGKGLEIVTTGRGDLFRLPPFELPADRAAILRMEITSPAQTMMELGYRTHGNPTFARERSYRVQLHEGANDVYVQMEIPDLLGRLLVRPGRDAGRYVFHSIEVRLVTR